MLKQLRQRLQALQKPAGIADGPRVLPLGIAAIDAALGGGFARGAPNSKACIGDDGAAPTTQRVAAVEASCTGLARNSSASAPLVAAASESRRIATMSISP